MCPGLRSFWMVVPLLLASCDATEPGGRIPPGHELVIPLDSMLTVEAAAGELVHMVRGYDHGLDDLSLTMTETAPGAGPDLHWHVSDEVHIIQEGRVTYILLDSVFTVEGPAVVNVPARVPHTFINAGDSLLRLTAVFSRGDFGGYHPLGPNPLRDDTP